MNHISMMPRRKVCAATFNYYQRPTLHPDRIMDEHDMVYMEHGDWEVSQDGVSYDLHAGDVFVLAAGRHHYGTKPCTPGTRTMFLHIQAESEDGLGQGAYTIPILIPAGTMPSLRTDFRNLIDAWWTEAPNRDIRVAAYLDILLCDLAAAHPLKQMQYGWPVDAVHSIIVNDPSINFTIQQLADQLHLSERRLRYLFKNVSGESLHQYLLNLKLSMAKQALQTSPGSRIADVAAAFGFWDEYHFHRAYKKRFQCTPGQASAGMK